MSISIYFDSYQSFFDDELTVNAEYSSENNSALLVVGKVGYDSIEQIIKRGHRAVFSFDQDFEVRLLKIDTTCITVDVRRIEKLKAKYLEFIEISIGSIPESNEKFSQQEINELKEKLTTLQQNFAAYEKFSREEAAYARTSFELLIKKLDDSSKSAWKHTASGIGAS
ncbi:hypothetical protein ACRTC3_22735, partial [Photobacterium damselae]|uniref:hypothetical protein n=1 Tax=Photobacterium damselae TaxID=38293 RepID=UPI003D7EFB2D